MNVNANVSSLFLVKGEGVWILDQQILDFVAGLLEHRKAWHCNLDRYCTSKKSCQFVYCE